MSIQASPELPLSDEDAQALLLAGRQRHTCEKLERECRLLASKIAILITLLVVIVMTAIIAI